MLRVMSVLDVKIQFHYVEIKLKKSSINLILNENSINAQATKFLGEITTKFTVNLYFNLMRDLLLP